MRIKIDGDFFRVRDEEGNFVFGSIKNGKVGNIISANYFGYEYSFTHGIWKRYGRIAATRAFNAWITYMQKESENLVQNLYAAKAKAL